MMFNENFKIRHLIIYSIVGAAGTYGFLVFGLSLGQFLK